MSREAVWTPLELVRWTGEYFKTHGVESPRLDAELLLAHALGARRIDLYLRFDQPLQADERAGFRELVRRRARERVPVAYLTGTREFWSRALRVTPDVLIPRPETEVLVQLAAKLAPRRAADIGVGSGAIALALALELPELQLEGVDVSEAALAIARENLAAHGVAERVTLRYGRGLAPLQGRFDLIASNPPYVPSAELDQLAPELRHEPRIALDGGPDGLDVVRELVAGAGEKLVPGGHLLLEIGADQAERTRELLRAAGAAAVEIHPDLAGRARVALARFD
jgi:release factor glutamine methyltransferase